MNKTRICEYSILMIFIIIVILYHLFGYIGHYGFDDLHYAELASDLLKGSVNLEDHFSYRFPVILFTSLSYLIFGVSDFSSSLPALVISIVILLIVFNILREQGPKALLIGLCLTTFSNWFIFYSDKLMPDIYVALSVILAVAIIHRYKYKSDRSKTGVWAFLLALSLLFGFMAKGTIVLVLPLLLFVMITDIIRKRDQKFWIYSIISGMILLALYLFIIWMITGDLMKRFDTIADNSYLNRCSYDQQSLKILLKRIFFGFFELTIYQSLATGFIFVFAVLFKKGGLRYFRLDDSFSFFLVSAVILFLSSSFMTISPTSYAPMCLDPRHYLFLVPVAAIPASRIIVAFLENKQAGSRIIIVLFCVTFISFFLQGDTFWKLYLPLLGLFIIYFFIGVKKQYQYVFLILFAAILLLVPYDMIQYAQQVKYRKQKEIVIEQVLENNKDYTIITNKVQKRLLAYYSQFDEDQTRRFRRFGEYETDVPAEGKTLMLLNGHTRYLSLMNQNDLPYYARHIPPVNRLVFENRELNISIYDMKEFPLPGLNDTTLLLTFNDFETEVPYWKQKDLDISEDIRYEGVRSNRVAGFSSTFEYPLDSLHIQSMQSLLIQCTLFCYAEDKTDTKIIVSLENSSGNYLWQGLKINKYLKAYSNWWPISFDVTVGHQEIQEASVLKVYLWQGDNPDVYVDNFSIKIVGLDQ